ncbi:MAG: hypothetical protein PVI03_03920 [Candidatus Thorarchaeota archaeon]|jgi:hypothetical protein
MAIPVEIITALGGVLIGGVLKLWGMKQQAQVEQNRFFYQMSNLKEESFQAARAIKDKHTQWTRRIIALTAVFSIILLPKLAAIFSDITVTVGWTEIESGFLFFTDDKETLRWRELSGLVITPLDTHFCSLIAGMYFGGSLVGHNK